MQCFHQDLTFINPYCFKLQYLIRGTNTNTCAIKMTKLRPAATATTNTTADTVHTPKKTSSNSYSRCISRSSEQALNYYDTHCVGNE